MEQTEARPEAGRRLVLGFDAGCMTCSELAKKIEDRVGEKLEIRSLNEPMMHHWRREAFGENAPWAPTLVEVKGDTVRAWTGVRMGARLSRALGPVATWRVMQALGEANAELHLVDSPAVSAVSGLTRGQFLKGVGGAVVAMSVLSGTGSLAATAGAEEHWLSQLSFTTSKEISKKQAGAAWEQLSRDRHLRRLLSSSAMDENPAARRMRGRLLSAPKNGIASSPTSNIKGVRHQLEGGGQLLALAYQEDDALIVSYRLDEPGQKTRLFSRVMEDESEELIRILAEAEDKDVFVASQEAVRAGRSCTSGRQCPGTCSICKCASLNKRCAFNCCGACGLACLGKWYTCLACIFLWCPICSTVNRCCNYKECGYNPACS